MKVFEIKQLCFFVVMLLVSSLWAKDEEFDLPFIQKQFCQYSEITQKYCADNSEPAWVAGSVNLKITDDSLVVFTHEQKKYSFRYNRLKKDSNSDGESIVVLTGQSKKGNKYMLVLGSDYFNLINTKKWALYFLMESKSKKKNNLKNMDFGKITYSTASLVACEYNKETEKYEDNCSFDNFKEVFPFEIRTRMRRDNLYLAIDTLPEINITQAEESETKKGVKVKIFSGVDEEGEDVHVILAPTYFNFVSKGVKLVFSEEKLPDDLVKPRIYTGSSVAVADDILVTNAHVTEKMSSLTIYQDGKVVKTDSIDLIGEMPKEVLDFAVIKVYGAKLNACPIATKEPGLGTEILVYGYPKIGIQGNDLKVTKGIVSGKNGFMGNKKMFQMDAAIQPGNSGGPIVSKGKVIGLATSTLVGDDVQNANSGIKASKMVHLLRFFDVEPKSNTSDFSKCTYLLVGED